MNFTSTKESSKNVFRWIDYSKIRLYLFFFTVSVEARRPTDEDLEELSVEIADKWDKLARRLGFDRAKVTAYHKDYDKLADKAYNMLMDWKQREGSAATYQVLYEALCHRLVGCKDLAEKFCCYQ